MSTVLTRRRPSRAYDRDRETGRGPVRQESLFGAAAPVAPTAPAAPAAAAVPMAPAAPRPAAALTLPMTPVEAAAPVASPPGPGPERVSQEHDPAVLAPARVAGPTLDEVIAAVWGELHRADAVACPVCGVTAMQPRHSAGAGVVGGRCGACETTLA